MSANATNAPSTLSEWLVYWRIDLQLLVALACCAALAGRRRLLDNGAVGRRATCGIW